MLFNLRNDKLHSISLDCERWIDYTECDPELSSTNCLSKNLIKHNKCLHQHFWYVQHFFLMITENVIKKNLMKSPDEFNTVITLFFLLKGCTRFGFYGEFCEKPCPRNCKHCHPSTGECLGGCSTGYYGHHCLLYNRGNCDHANNSLYNKVRHYFNQIHHFFFASIALSSNRITSFYTSHMNCNV